MASAQMSGFGVTQLRGSVGGNTIQVNANGLFIRDKPIPTQPGTGFQVGQQARFVEVTGTWATLSNDQRSAWIAFAETTAGEYQNRLGETRNYTGQQLFIKLNLEAYATAFPISDPPIVPTIPAIPATDLVIRLVSGTLDTAVIDFGVLLSEEGFTMKIFATAGLSQGIMRPRSSLLKYITEFQTNIGGSTYDFTTEYFDRYGDPVLGKKVFVKTYMNGNLNGFSAAQSLISATVIEPG